MSKRSRIRFSARLYSSSPVGPCSPSRALSNIVLASPPEAISTRSHPSSVHHGRRPLKPAIPSTESLIVFSDRCPANIVFRHNASPLSECVQLALDRQSYCFSARFYILARRPSYVHSPVEQKTTRSRAAANPHQGVFFVRIHSPPDNRGPENPCLQSGIRRYRRRKPSRLSNSACHESHPS